MQTLGCFSFRQSFPGHLYFSLLFCRRLAFIIASLCPLRTLLARPGPVMRCSEANIDQPKRHVMNWLMHTSSIVWEGVLRPRRSFDDQQRSLGGFLLLLHGGSRHVPATPHRPGCTSTRRRVIVAENASSGLNQHASNPIDAIDF